MSRLETPMTVEYWDRMGGLLIEEYPIIPRSATSQRRCVDGLIISGRPKDRANWRDVTPSDFADADLVIVQTKQAQLGTYLMGQAVCSRELVKRRLGPRSVKAVALCSRTDSELEPLLTPHDVGVVVLDSYASPSEKKEPARALLNSYWEQVGGTLIRNFPLVAETATSAPHFAEAIILPREERREASPADVRLDGQEVVLAQSINRFSMYVTGQAIFSLALLRKHQSVGPSRSVAVVPRDDSEIRPLYDLFPGVEPVVVAA